MKKINLALYILVLVALVLTARCHALEPDCDCKDGVCPVAVVQPACMVKSGTQDPLQVASDAVNEDAHQVNDIAEAQAEAQVQVDKQTALLKQVQDKLAQDRAAYNALLDNLNKPQPKPVVAKKIEIWEVTQAGCKLCDKDEFIAQAVQDGIPIQKIDISDKRFTVLSTPTSIITVDGKEIQRIVGRLDLPGLHTWLKTIQDWSK